MCGSGGQMYKAEIEESVLTVCQKCSNYGKVISEIKPEIKPIKKEPVHIPVIPSRKEVLFVVVEDFAEKIKKKRESLNLKQEDFAKQINEKVSMMKNIETGKLTPNIQLARKLEKSLGLRLIEQHEEVSQKLETAKSEEFTIGDLIKTKK